MVKEFVRLSEEIFLMCSYIKKTVNGESTIKLKDMMENQGIKYSFSKIVDNIYVSVVLVNSKGALVVVFIKYIWFLSDIVFGTSWILGFLVL